MGNGTITIKKSTFTKIIIGIAVLLVGYLLFMGLSSDDVDYKSETVKNTNTVQNNQPSFVALEITDEDNLIGSPDANMVVVEFSDFECPFCERAYSGTVAGLKNSDLYKNGEVSFVYKHFPLNSIHPKAQKAAEASECAGEQGKFWEYHDTLFENQGSLDLQSLKNYAVQLGLDSNEFNDCLDSGEKAGKVSKDLQMAKDTGGRGTPYFIIYNQKTKEGNSVAGAVPFSQIETAINNLI